MVSDQMSFSLRSYKPNPLSLSVSLSLAEGCFSNVSAVATTGAKGAATAPGGQPCNGHGSCEMSDVGTFCKCHVGHTGTFCEHSE